MDNGTVDKCTLKKCKQFSSPNSITLFANALHNCMHRFSEPTLQSPSNVFNSSLLYYSVSPSSLACWDEILSVIVLRREANSEKMNCVQPAWWHFLKNCAAGLILDPKPDEPGGPGSPGDPEPQLESGERIELTPDKCTLDM